MNLTYPLCRHICRGTDSHPIYNEMFDCNDPTNRGVLRRRIHRIVWALTAWFSNLATIITVGTVPDIHSLLLATLVAQFSNFALTFAAWTHAIFRSFNGMVTDGRISPLVRSCHIARSSRDLFVWTHQFAVFEYCPGDSLRYSR